MSSKTISVKVSERVWGRLASIAANRGVLVADLLAEALDAVLASPRGPVKPEAVRFPSVPLPIVLPPVEGRLAELKRELDAARADGWRVPKRGKGI